MKWRSIRLELGGTREFPAGSVSRAYLIRLPLDDQDNIDTVAFDSDPSRATVRRHWASDPDERGHLVHDEGGWKLRCNGSCRELAIGSVPIRLGEKVSIADGNGTVLPFRIASIR